jgi:DNA repair exonuclease SbcCD ATPase subunit
MAQQIKSAFSVDWESIITKYLFIKKIYIECEESDPELKTNLQPLNEFRAALDHIRRLIAKEKNIAQDALSSDDEESKLIGHFRRAFFDVCDMLSINYRNKISEFLKPYGYDTIKTVFPDYYAVTRSRIEEINTLIASYRNEKGQNIENDLDSFDKYSKLVLELKELYCDFTKRANSLEEIHNEKRQHEKKENKKWLIPFIVASGLAVVGIVTTVVLAITR